MRHSLEADVDGSLAEAIDPDIVLADWTRSERRTLLERPLFGFASYGRVRFHHRSAWEYLAAQRLLALVREARLPIQRLRHRLLVRLPDGSAVLRPSLQAVAAWVALENTRIFALIRNADPHVLLSEGDPQSFTEPQLIEVFRSYAQRYGGDGWNGKTIPHVPIRRFASLVLGETIQELWGAGITNPEVRRTILLTIAHGRINVCSSIVESLAFDAAGEHTDRHLAVAAMVALNHARVAELPASILTEPGSWPDRLVVTTLVHLFPEHLNVDDLLAILTDRHASSGELRDLARALARTCREVDLPADELEQLLRGLGMLVRDGFTWREPWEPAHSSHAALAPVLAAVCERVLVMVNADATTDVAVNAAALAMVLRERDGDTEDWVASLKQCVARLPSRIRARLFVATVSLLDQFHPTTSAHMHLHLLQRQGCLIMDFSQDEAWLAQLAADSGVTKVVRETALRALVHIGFDQSVERSAYCTSIEAQLDGSPELLVMLTRWLAPLSPEQVEERRRFSDASAEHARKVEADRADGVARWERFHAELIQNPDECFSEGRVRLTAHNLWSWMRCAESREHKSGWNRPVLESYCGTVVADRLRTAL